MVWDDGWEFGGMGMRVIDDTLVAFLILAHTFYPLNTISSDLVLIRAYTTFSSPRETNEINGINTSY